MAWERWAVTSLDWAGRISPGPLALQNLHQAKSLSQESLPCDGIFFCPEYSILYPDPMQCVRPQFSKGIGLSLI